MRAFVQRTGLRILFCQHSQCCRLSAQSSLCRLISELFKALFHLKKILFLDQTVVQNNSRQNPEHLQGVRSLQRHLAEDAQRHSRAGQTVQGVRHEEVSAEHEQGAEEASSGQK